MWGVSRQRKRNTEHSVHIPLGLKTHWPRMNAWLTDWLIPSGWFPIDSIKLCTIDHIYQKCYSSTKQGQEKEADLTIHKAGMVEWLRCGMTFGQSLSLNLHQRFPAEEKMKKGLLYLHPPKFLEERYKGYKSNQSINMVERWISNNNNNWMGIVY